MNKKMMKQLFLLITYTFLLVLILVKVDIVLTLVKQVFNIIKPIGIGIGVAFVINIPYKFFWKRYHKIATKKERLAKILAVITSYILLLGVVIAIIGFVVPEISKSAKKLYENINDYQMRLEYIMNEGVAYFNLEEIDLSNFDSLFENIPDVTTNLLTGIFPYVFDTTKNILFVITNIVLGFVLSIYLLFDKDRLLRQIVKLIKVYLPSDIGHKVLDVARISNRTFGKFVVGQVKEATILGILCYLGMIVFGFEYPLLISTIIGVTSLIPIAGPVIGSIPSVFILLMTNPLEALWFLVFLIVLQQLEGDLIYPKVVGESIGLPALWVLVAIIVGGGLFGIIGMILGVPITSVVYKLVREDVLSQTGE